jgi:hypothetical protein
MLPGDHLNIEGSLAMAGLHRIPPPRAAGEIGWERRRGAARLRRKDAAHRAAPTIAWPGDP